MDVLAEQVRAEANVDIVPKKKKKENQEVVNNDNQVQDSGTGLVTP